MDNLKVYLGGNAEFKAVILECLTALGYRWLGEPNYLEQRNPDAIFGSYNGVISIEETVSRSMFEPLYGSYRTVTANDLREMLVLQRNDVNDATHFQTIYPDSNFYLSSNRDVYMLDKGAWIASGIRPSELTPIAERPIQYAEFLEKQEDGSYILKVLPAHAGDDKKSGLIAVPDGAEVFMTGFYNDGPRFYKDDFFSSRAPQDSKWWDCSSSLNLLKSNGGKIAWQRNPAEPDSFLKEYLTPDFRVILANEPQDGWFEVPVGADKALCRDHGSYYAVEFYRGERSVFDTSKQAWVHGLDWRTREGFGFKVVWQRDPQPQETHKDFFDQLNDLCAEFDCPPGRARLAWLREQLTAAQTTPSTDTVYHYSASFNTPRGTVSYDGVITFTGRITGIEDYHKVRAEIAKDGNVTPDQVNVHSLTIVG